MYTGFYTPLPAGGRFVVDANVLLNAVFLPDGFARKALSSLRTLGRTGLIDDSIDVECRRRIERLALQAALPARERTMLLDVFDRLAPELTPLRLPGVAVPPQLRDLPADLEHDVHVLSACVGHDAWLLTSDANLIIAARGAGIESRSPWDAVAHAADVAGVPPATEYLFRFVEPESNSGFVFAHVSPGDWAETAGNKFFTVCEVGGVGRLFYEQRRERWVFEGFGTSIGRKASVRGGRHYTVCASYRFGSERKGRINVYVGSSELAPLLPSSCEVRRSSMFRLSGVSYGARLSGQDPWFGHLRSIAVGPQFVSAGHFAKLFSLGNATPDPHDWKMLALAIRNAVHSPDPSERDLVRYGV